MAPIVSPAERLTQSATALGQGLCQWLNARLPIADLQAAALKKKVPVHKAAFWYYLGGIALVFLLVQLVSGLLLMAYYIPEMKSAYTSILTITSKVEFGWFVRSLHSWGANLMILALFFHLFSAYFMKAYRKPRELTWLTGLALMGIAFGFGFTGYLLPWDEVAFFATKIGLDITSKLPLLGEPVAHLLRGGDTVGQGTLSRFFLIHVMVLPLLIAGGLGVHLLLVQQHGMSEPDAFKALPPEKKEYMAFFPTFALKDAMVWLLVLNVLAAFATLSPWGLGPQADAFAPAPVGIKPEWYFLAPFQLLKLFPPMVGPFEGEQVGMVFFGLIAALFVLIPFWDTGKNKALDTFATWYGWAVVIGFIAFTIWGFMA